MDRVIGIGLVQCLCYQVRIDVKSDDCAMNYLVSKFWRNCTGTATNVYTKRSERPSGLPVYVLSSWFSSLSLVTEKLGGVGLHEFVPPGIYQM